MIISETFREILRDFLEERCGKLSEFGCLRFLESLRVCKMRGKWFPSRLYIEGKNELELSRSKF